MLAEAEKELRRLRTLAPKRVDTQLLLGQLLFNRGKFEEAELCLTEAIDGTPRAFQELADVRRMTEADRPLLDRMCAVLERPDLEAMSRISVHFGLGKAFDDLGDYAEAMRHYDAGNRLKAMSARLDRRALVAEVDSIVAGFTAEALGRRAQSMARPPSPGDDLPVFIVGMPRSGTTLVEQILCSHPAVTAGGELSFWKDGSARGALRASGPCRPMPLRTPPKTIARSCANSVVKRCG